VLVGIDTVIVVFTVAITSLSPLYSGFVTAEYPGSGHSVYFPSNQTDWDALLADLKVHELRAPADWRLAFYGQSPTSHCVLGPVGTLMGRHANPHCDSGARRLQPGIEPVWHRSHGGTTAFEACVSVCVWIGVHVHQLTLLGCKRVYVCVLLRVFPYCVAG